MPIASCVGKWGAMKSIFRTFAHRTAEIVGSPAAFMTGVGITIIWAITGPLFHYSDTWQPVINTGTTIVTFLMVFLIQNTQNRYLKTLHLKLDEFIRAGSSARNRLVASLRIAPTRNWQRSKRNSKSCASERREENLQRRRRTLNCSGSVPPVASKGEACPRSPSDRWSSGVF